MPGRARSRSVHPVSTAEVVPMFRTTMYSLLSQMFVGGDGAPSTWKYAAVTFIGPATALAGPVIPRIIAALRHGTMNANRRLRCFDLAMTGLPTMQRLRFHRRRHHSQLTPGAGFGS